MQQDALFQSMQAGAHARLDTHRALPSPSLCPRPHRQPWRKFITEDNRHLVTPEALDLLSKLLTYDHQLRPTAAEAMAHEYFNPVRNTAAASGSS